MITITYENAVAKFSKIGACLTHLEIFGSQVVLNSDGDKPMPYSGIIGRVANRTNPFYLQDTLVTPSSPLHGGVFGFDQHTFKSKMLSSNSVEFTLESEDGDQNYPSSVNLKAIFSLKQVDSAIELDLLLLVENSGVKDTVVNLTYHPHFNLDGFHGLSDHFLKIPGQISRLVVDDAQFATGQEIPVSQENSSFRFDKGIKLDAIDSIKSEQNFGGYDHFFMIQKQKGLVVAAELVAKTLALQIHTDYHGLQIYTGNFLDGSVRKCPSQDTGKWSCIALEPSHPPNAVNHEKWRDLVILKAGEQKCNRIVYRFEKV